MLSSSWGGLRAPRGAGTGICCQLLGAGGSWDEAGRPQLSSLLSFLPSGYLGAVQQRALWVQWLWAGELLLPLLCCWATLHHLPGGCPNAPQTHGCLEHIFLRRSGGPWCLWYWERPGSPRALDPQPFPGSQKSLILPTRSTIPFLGRGELGCRAHSCDKHEEGIWVPACSHSAQALLFSSSGRFGLC